MSSDNDEYYSAPEEDNFSDLTEHDREYAARLQTDEQSAADSALAARLQMEDGDAALAERLQGEGSWAARHVDLTSPDVSGDSEMAARLHAEWSDADSALAARLQMDGDAALAARLQGEGLWAARHVDLTAPDVSGDSAMAAQPHASWNGGVGAPVPVVMEVAGDGDCLFHALNVAMHGPIEFFHPNALRRVICDHLNKDAGDKMRKPGTYGTEDEVGAVCGLYGYNVVVFNDLGAVVYQTFATPWDMEAHK